MTSRSTTPFQPKLYEIAGAWHYEDGRMLASIQFGPLPDGSGEGLRILEWMCNDKGKGCSVEALEWLRQRFSFITADCVGLADEQGLDEPALRYWIHMRRRGLVEELIDDRGRRLVVTEADVHTLPDRSDMATWSPSGPLFHIGTLKPEDKGARGDSYEGHGLSVSEHPSAWEAIAKLGGQPWWSLQPPHGKAPAVFLDWHATPREHRDAMLAWAAEEGLVEPRTGYRVNHHDFDHNEMVFVVFEDEAAARAELQWMLEEHEENVDALEMMQDNDSNGGGPAPTMEAFEGWKLTQKALARLRRAKANLEESPVLAALLYCESMTELDGVYWNDTLSVSQLSAPRAVLFPGRLGRFSKMPVARSAAHVSEGPGDVDDEGPEEGSRRKVVIMHSEPLDPIERAIYQAVESANAKALKRHMERALPGIVNEMLGLHWKKFNGTFLYRCLTRAAMHAEAGGVGGAADWVVMNAACADLLRTLSAPCESKEYTNAAGPIFLSADWGAGHSGEVMTRLMRDSVAAGDFDVNERLPYVGTECDGFLPLDAAFQWGNAQAAQVLLDAGASLSATLDGTAYLDIVEYAGSFRAPRSREVVSVVTQALMSRQLLENNAAPAADTAPTNLTDSSSAGTQKKGRGRRMGL